MSSIQEKLTLIENLIDESKQESLEEAFKELSYFKDQSDVYINQIRPIKIKFEVFKEDKNAGKNIGGILEDILQKIGNAFKQFKNEQELQLSKKYFNPQEIEDLRQIEKNALLISIKKNRYIFFRSPNGDQAQYQISQEKFPQRVMSILQRLLLEDNMKENEFEILGTSLYQRLFASEDVRQIFNQLIENARKTKIPIKIILRFDDESSALACLPWEYLYCPLDESSGIFLGETQELILTRRLSFQGPEKLLETQELKVLIAVSKHLSEEDTQKTDEREEIQLKQAIEKIASNDKKVSCQIAYFSSLKQMTDYLAKESIAFDCIHLIGMARIDDKKEGDDKFEVALTDSFTKKADMITWMGYKEFIHCFGNHKPSLIFLHSGKDSPEDSYLAFSGFAFHLVKEVSGVMAIQAPVGSLNAVNFSNYIYKSMINDETDLDNAVKNSLWEMAKSQDKSPKAKAYGMTATFSRQALKLVFNAKKNINQSEVEEVRCKFDNERLMPKKRCDNEIELIKLMDGDVTVYKLKEKNVSCCSRCGNDLEFCTYCGYLVNTKNDIKCSACKLEIVKGDPLQVSAIFDKTINTEQQTDKSSFGGGR